MNRTLALLTLLALAGCSSQPEETKTLPEARKDFKPKQVGGGGPRQGVDQPPPQVFRVVQYEAPVGKLAAYLTPDPKDGKKRPAIIWITGGDCNSIGEVWNPA